MHNEEVICTAWSFLVLFISNKVLYCFAIHFEKRHFLVVFLPKEVSRKIENCEPALFKTLLKRIYAELIYKREECEPKSLKVMPASLDRVDRYLKNKVCSCSFVRQSVRPLAVVGWKSVTASLGWQRNCAAWHRPSVLSKLQRAFTFNTTLKNSPKAKLCRVHD